LLLILLLATALRLQYLHAPLLDAHRWRQVDTASIARTFYEGSINPLKPEASWGGAHGYVERVPPDAGGLALRVFGPDEMWGRLIVIFFSVLAVALTYVLERDLLDEPAALAAALLVAVSPGAVFYGRAFARQPVVCFRSPPSSASCVLPRRRHVGPGLGRLRLCVRRPRQAARSDHDCANRRCRLAGKRWACFGTGDSCSRWASGAVAAAWHIYAYAIYLETGLTFGIFGTTKTYPMTVGPGPGRPFSKWSTIELLTSWQFYETMLSRLWVLHLTPPGFALAAGFLLWRACPAARLWTAGSWRCGLHPRRGVRPHGARLLSAPTVPIALYFGAAARPVFDASWIRGALGPARVWAPVIGLTLVALSMLAFLHSGVIEHHFRPETPDIRMQQAGDAINDAAADDALLVVVDDYGVNSPMLLYFAHARGWSLDADTARPELVRGLVGQGARYFATTRWSQLIRRQPDLKLYLDSRREVELKGAPTNTALFDLTASR
jgi:hypothetical protein